MAAIWPETKQMKYTNNSSTKWKIFLVTGKVYSTNRLTLNKRSVNLTPTLHKAGIVETEGEICSHKVWLLYIYVKGGHDRAGEVVPY
jgi:hypothetical protein